ncbi:Rid family hydrolase [Microvirga sp. 2TAF3]|uniref:Rid family hydrolase n=1 Tax=Microvirga sp. 2TAF3 TaxID=3233014 RepID=UPI003F9E9063
MSDMNPFPPADEARHAIWEMLVHRDIDAFVAGDWDAHFRDFAPDLFFGIDARFSDNPDSWRVTYADIARYREAWLSGAKELKGRIADGELRRSIFALTTLRDIEIMGDFALARKKFDGAIRLNDGEAVTLRWQTQYFCRRIEGRWRIAGFLGYLPNPMGSRNVSEPVKRAPAATQAPGNGPYSPVIEVAPGKIVVVSGQAAVGPDGKTIGSDIRTQARVTIENCAMQLRNAGCSLADVFKVNVYMTDLNDWPAFNEIYAEMMPPPLPVRTAVETKLLRDFVVEIELWAVKP